MPSNTDDLQSVVEQIREEVIDQCRGTRVIYRQKNVDYEVNVDFGVHEPRAVVDDNGTIKSSFEIQELIIPRRYFASDPNTTEANPIPLDPQRSDKIIHVVNGFTKTFGLRKGDAGRWFIRLGIQERRYRIITVLESREPV